MASNLLRPSTRIRANPELITSRMGDEVVMMSLERGNYYGLDPIASRIWEMLAEETSISAICEQLLRDYEVTPEACAADVSSLLSRMADEGMVEVREGAG